MITVEYATVVYCEGCAPRKVTLFRRLANAVLLYGNGEEYTVIGGIISGACKQCRRPFLCRLDDVG